MKDLILREIELTGKVLEAILLKIGRILKNGGENHLSETVRNDMREGLGLDFDSVVAERDPAGTLTDRYGFDNGSLEKFAEILYLLASSSPDTAARRQTAAAAISIYEYLEAHASCCFFDRYHIRKELEKYL